MFNIELDATVISAGIVMLFAFVGMLVCAKKQRTNPNAQYLAIGLLVLVIACGAMIMTRTMGDGDTKWLIENEQQYARSAALMLGRDLGKTHPGSRVLLIVNHNYEKNKRAQSMIAGLKEGLGTKMSKVAVDSPEIKRPNEEMPMMMEEMMTAADFDAVIDKNNDCNLIISFIGLPHDTGDMKIWEMEDALRPKLALLFNEIYDKGEAIAAGAIVAAVTYKPGVKFTDDACPKDPEKAFEERYIIVTPSNIEKIASENPGMFKESAN